MSAPNAAQERLIISLAMGILGRRGGRVTSAKKADAVRANGQKGGRPRGPNYKPRRRPVKAQ